MSDAFRYSIGGSPAASSGARVSVYPDSEHAAAAVAREIADLIRARAAEGRRAVLGLATGSTPQGVYDELVGLHREGLSFRNVVTFNLDEYWPMAREAVQSYHRFMAEYLFDHVDIDRANVHIPDGGLRPDDVPAFCQTYERQIRDAGGIDLQLLGIGRTGHIGFNEPGSRRDSRTRLITLDRVTRMDAASDFFGEWNVPRKALTMGVATILDARRVVLMAFGEGKAAIIRQAIEGELTNAVAASFLQQHANAEFVLDPAAASELTPIKTPWLLGPVSQCGQAWDEPTIRRAVIWLARKVNKPILKLVTEDYNEHGLEELLSTRGSAYNVNIGVFKALQNTITGWPGGKRAGHVPARSGGGAKHAPVSAAAFPQGEASSSRTDRDAGNSRDRPQPETAPLLIPADRADRVHPSRRPEVFPKRVVVFSPHPDDDVISMGGTLIRLCQQGHDVHVAYQTSGNIAVFDDKAMRHADFVTEFARAFGLLAERDIARIEEAVEQFIRRKSPGEIDSLELQKIKGIIRRSEARAAARYAGLKEENIHFLDLPFYETGRVRKRPLGDQDVRIVMELLHRIQPHQVYAAGDLSDPHGTHRVCLKAITLGIQRLRGDSGNADWLDDCDVWLYRGAWQEWEPHQIDMAVPLSPDEVERKRVAIFFHESQKDKALFPGPQDTREFWQRAEARNRGTAEIYDRLGLPEYEAIEAFVRWAAE